MVSELGWLKSAVWDNKVKITTHCFLHKKTETFTTDLKISIW